MKFLLSAGGVPWPHALVLSVTGRAAFELVRAVGIARQVQQFSPCFKHVPRPRAAAAHSACLQTRTSAMNDDNELNPRAQYNRPA